MRRWNRRKRAGRKTRRTRRRGPTRRSAGIGRGLMSDKPMELVIHKGLGFPARTRTKLRYHEVISITSAAGALNTYSYTANGLYDPNLSGTGHQPMYFDQYMLVYNHYKVLGSKIEVRCIPNSGEFSSGVNAFQCAVVVNDDSSVSPITDFGTLIEEGNLDSFLVLGGAYSALGQKKMYAKWSCKRYFKEKYQDTSLTGTSLANPTEYSAFMIIQQPVSNATITNYYEVTIDYITDFYELKDIAQS